MDTEIEIVIESVEEKYDCIIEECFGKSSKENSLCVKCINEQIYKKKEPRSFFVIACNN